MHTQLLITCTYAVNRKMKRKIDKNKTNFVYKLI